MRMKFLAIATAILFILNCFAIVNSELEQISYCDPSVVDSQQSLLFVSTLDGKISALDPLTGKLKWTLGLDNKPLLSSNIHRRELNNNGQWVRLIPSLNGALYKFDGDSVEFIPVTAEQLLKSSFRFSDDLVFSGGKETRSYGILRSTGEIVYECSINGCKNSTNGENRDDDLLLIQRYQHTVRAVDPRNGLERWNFSVGQLELSLINNPSFDCSNKKGPNLSDLEVKVIVPEGLVWTVNRSNPHVKLWEHKFKSPIVSVWRQGEDIVATGKMGLHEVNLFNNAHWTSDYASNPALYIAMHEKQLYIQENPIYGKTLEYPIHVNNGDLMKFPWRPYPVLAYEEETKDMTNKDLALVSSETRSTTAISILYNSEYVNGNGFYLYSDDQLDFPENTQCNKTVIEGINFIEQPSPTEDDTPVQIIIVSIWYYWKEILAISVTTAFVLNFFIDSKLNFFRKRAKDTVLKVPVVDGHIEEKIVEERKISVCEDDNNFSSRFLTDFDPVTRLGKGGFGIVFEAKNKIDDCHYAIKRITLPNSQDSRDRVMREVKALAKLEHQNIVRYFNAWLECPPIGWQEEQDENLRKNGIIPIDLECTQEPSQSETEAESKFDNNSLDDSAIEARETSCDNEDDDDDDFIQFEYSNDNGKSNDYEINDQSMSSIEDSSTSNSNCNKELFMNSSDENNINSEADISECDNKDTQSQKSDKSEKSCKSKNIKISTNSIVEEKPKLRPKVSSKAPKMYLYIQMQLCQRKSLRDWLKQCELNRDFTRANEIFQQIVEAVEYVHLKGLIHRDLKPSNIFFAYDGTIKIGDFGLVTAMPDSFLSPIELNDLKVKDGQYKEVVRTAEVGTQLYMSPEQMNGKIYNYKVDIYSLGIILFELLTPFSTEMERYESLSNLRKSVFPENFAVTYPAEYTLLQLMLDDDPERRPTTLQIKGRPLFCYSKHDKYIQ